MAVSTHTKTRQQRWAIDADAKVQVATVKDDWKAWHSVAKKGPTLIQQCGLVQAIAFLRSRKEAASRTYADDLAALLLDGLHQSGAVKAMDSAALFEHVRRANLASYLALSRQAIDAAVWLRRLAQIEQQRRGDA